MISVKGEEDIKLAKRERDMATCLGQSFHMTLEVTEKKGDQPRVEEIDLLAGLPEEAWMTEFIPAPEPEETEEPDVGDEFGMGEDLGMEGETIA